VVGKGTPSVGYYFSQAGDGSNRTYFTVDGTTSMSTTVFNDNIWHHIVGVYNGTHQMLYVDGDREDIDANTGSFAPSGTNLIMGERTDHLYSRYYIGILDEIRISDTARSASYINQTYQNAIGTAGYGNLGAEEEAQLSNTAPTITANVTKPDNVYTNTDWMLNLTVTDPDSGDNLTAYTEFYVNSSSVGSVYSLNVTNGTNTNVDNLSTSEFNKGATLIAEFWAGDETENTTKYNTTEITVLNSLPSQVNLSYPENNDSFFTNRTPRFNWTAATDADDDILVYQFQLSIHSDVSSPLIDEENMSNLYYDQQTELDFDTYYWKVRANDSEGAGVWSDIWNFTLTPSVSIVFVNDSISFGSMELNEINDTTNDAPKPFILEHMGNTEANVSIKATSLWSSASAPLNTSYFQFKADNSTETNSFDWLNSQTIWSDMSDIYKEIIGKFNYSDSNDLAEIEIRVKVPLDEIPVQKSSIITVYGIES